MKTVTALLRVEDVDVTGLEPFKVKVRAERRTLSLPTAQDSDPEVVLNTMPKRKPASIRARWRREE